MADAKRVRIIKRGASERASESAKANGAAHAPVASREIKGVVSSWVREHSQRADEFRKNYSTLLRDLGFAPPQSCQT